MKPWKTLLFSTFFLLSAVALTAQMLFFPLPTHTELVEVENFCGSPYEEMRFPLWMEVQAEYVYDANAAPGIVLSQSIPAGSRRKLTQDHDHIKITLAVSLGEEHCVLPNVIGEDARTAAARLREEGFAVELVHSFGTYPQGTVFATEPHAGSSLPKGSRVLLSVSDGSPATVVRVPNVVGLSRAEAFLTLWRVGLRVTDVRETPSLFRAGSVIGQSLQAGTQVLSGTGIALEIAKEE